MANSNVWKSGLAIAALAAAVAGCTSIRSGNTVEFNAPMSGANEVPAVSTPATGMTKATFHKDTMTLTWRVTYSGLSGPATAGHIHGPAAAGANAGVVIPFASAASPIEGSATLTPAQVADLMAGKWYTNIHTAAHQSGEIRGQLIPNR